MVLAHLSCPENSVKEAIQYFLPNSSFNLDEDILEQYVEEQNIDMLDNISKILQRSRQQVECKNTDHGLHIYHHIFEYLKMSIICMLIWRLLIAKALTNYTHLKLPNTTPIFGILEGLFYAIVGIRTAFKFDTTRRTLEMISASTFIVSLIATVIIGAVYVLLRFKFKYKKPILLTSLGLLIAIFMFVIYMKIKFKSNSKPYMDEKMSTLFKLKRWDSPLLNFTDIMFVSISSWMLCSTALSGLYDSVSQMMDSKEDQIKPRPHSNKNK